MLRSVCHLQATFYMRSSDSTCIQSSVKRFLPAKNRNYRYFTFLSVILTSYHDSFQHAILPIFIFRFYCNHPRALFHTPSCIFKSSKCTKTEFTSKNTKISTLTPNNFFLADSRCTKFLWNAYICI